MIGIVSIFSKLFKTVGLLAVRLDLAKLRVKNRKRISIFEKNLNTLFSAEKCRFFKELKCFTWLKLQGFRTSGLGFICKPFLQPVDQIKDNR